MTSHPFYSSPALQSIYEFKHMINKSSKHKGLVPEYSTIAAEWFLVMLLSQSGILHQLFWPTASGGLGRTLQGTIYFGAMVVLGMRL